MKIEDIPMKSDLDIISHGKILLYDLVTYEGVSKCSVCGEPAIYVLVLGKLEIQLCYECLANMGHCVIDGLK